MRHGCFQGDGKRTVSGWNASCRISASRRQSDGDAAGRSGHCEKLVRRGAGSSCLSNNSQDRKIPCSFARYTFSFRCADWRSFCAVRLRWWQRHNSTHKYWPNQHRNRQVSHTNEQEQDTMRIPSGTTSSLFVLFAGSIVCDPAQPIPSTSRMRARIVVFNIEIPITKGFPVRIMFFGWRTRVSADWAEYCWPLFFVSSSHRDSWIKPSLTTFSTSIQHTLHPKDFLWKGQNLWPSLPPPPTLLTRDDQSAIGLRCYSLKIVSCVSSPFNFAFGISGCVSLPNTQWACPHP